MHFQDTNQGMGGKYGVGVKFPNYLQNPTAGQSQAGGGGNPQSFADTNRASAMRALGLGDVTDATGRMDYGKMIGAAKSFCV